MSYLSAELRRMIMDRAENCFEYCHLHEDDHDLAHEVDYIIPVKHRGTTSADNLCLSCFDCNRYKGSDIGSYDSDTGAFTPLFDPRTMRWDEHFRLEGAEIVPLAPVGQITEFLLRLNSSEWLVGRYGLIELERYPCSLA